jgi:hypothetical protein
MIDPIDLLPHEYEGAYDPTQPFSVACENLIATVDGLRDEFLSQEPYLRDKLRAAQAHFDRLRGDIELVEMKTRSQRVLYMAPPMKQPEFLSALRDVRKCQAAQQVMAGTHVLGLIAAFDTFEGELMRAAFKMQPKLLIPSERKLSWAEIADQPDKDAMRGLIVEREVDGVMREGHLEQLRVLGKRFNVRNLDSIDEVDALIEITERRNLYAHGGGRVTDFYLKKCGLRGSGHQPGDFLATDSVYFSAACDDIIVIALKLTQTIWRAVSKHSEIGAADRDLSQIGYEFVASGRLELARRVLKFACDLEKTSSEQHKMVFIANHAQVHKWLGNDKACENVLSQHQWDAKDEALQLSRAVLLDDFEEAARLMYNVGSTKQVQRSAFDHWPIYRRFRTTELFRAVYQDLYGGTASDVEGDALPA